MEINVLIYIKFLEQFQAYNSKYFVLVGITVFIFLGREEKKNFLFLLFLFFLLLFEF